MTDQHKDDDRSLPESIFKFAWKYTRRQQLWVLAVVLLSMPTYFLALDIPKRIVNGPIQGRGFPTEESTQTFLRIAFELPDWMGNWGTIQLFPGLTLDRVDSLFALSTTFLLLVIINGLFKFYINLYKGRLGERMLRRLRFELIDRVLRFPISHFKRVKQSEVASMVKDEVEPVGGFIGDAFVTPVLLGGQAITAMAFIMLQSFWLGLIAGGIVAVQAIVIPRLRRRLIELGRQRQLTARKMSGRVGELVDGITAVHVNDTSNYERADFSDRLGKIYFIRYELFKRKFFVKFLNNFLAQVTPFVFYLLGGYFALIGKIDIGQLVAVIAAYKDLPGPIKDLINWDQQRLDVQVKYTQVTEQFYSDGMIDRQLQQATLEPIEKIKDGFQLSGLSISDETGTKLIENINTKFNLGERIAVVGGLNSGGETLGDAIGRLLPQTLGKIQLDHVDLDELPEAKTGRRVGFVPSEISLFFGTFGDNLLYGLKNAPQTKKQYDGEEKKTFELAQKESRETGNSLLDINDDWINYSAAGVKDYDELIYKIMEVLKKVGLSSDVMNFGLRGTVDPIEHPDLAAKILAARKALKSRLTDKKYQTMVEFFDPSTYTTQATIAENILFGTSIDDALEGRKFYASEYLHKVIAAHNMHKPMYEMGIEMATTAIELFADLDPGHPFFEQLSFMSAEEMPEYQVALNRLKGVDYEDVDSQDQQMFIRLTFDYIEPRHRLGLLNDERRAKLLEVRHDFAKNLPDDLKGKIEFYDPETYNGASSVQDNILFGRIAYGVAQGEETILSMLRNILEEHALYDEIFSVGLRYDVGSGGKRLSSAQRQKLGLARALLKRPDFLIVNRSLAALDNPSFVKILEAVLESTKTDGVKQGLFWVLTHPDLALKFDRVLVLDEGRIVEDGPPQDLLKKQGKFAALVN